MVNNIIKNKFSIFWILIIFVVTFNYLSFNFFIKSFISLENKENGKTLSALITHLNTNLNTIKITTKDYSYWDDTYEFINDKNENYIYENFRDSTKTLDNLKLDFMIFMNLKNENIHTQISNNLNLKNKDDFRKYIVNQFKDKESTTIIKYEEEYYYLVRSEILKSDLSAESRGYIYTGRIVRLEEFTNDYKNSIKFIETNPMKIDITLKSKFINNIDVHFDYKNDLLSNIIFLKNNAQNSVTLKLDNYRDIYKEGKKQIILFNSIVSFFILVLFFIFYLYLNQHKKLNNQLKLRVEDEIKKQKIQEEILIHQAKSSEIGEMINNIAHQWRQPLNNLSLIIQNLSFIHQNGFLTQESLDKTIDKSKVIINSMSHTIDTFRNFFEPNKNKNLFKIEHSIDNTLEIMSSTLRFHNIKVVKEIIDEIEIFDYENEFSQVLLNIITNAKDALISNNIKNPEVQINVSEFDGNVIIMIKDNAKGISEEIIDKIFQAYFTTKIKGQGTGIGLYMSKLIIEKNMRGKLEVKNNSKGAIFKITLPIIIK